jgi:hypothetical protein
MAARKAKPLSNRKSLVIDEDASLRGLQSLSGGGSGGGRGTANMECYLCGKKGHAKAQCPNQTCHACGKKGHLKSECPNKGHRKSGGGGGGSRLSFGGRGGGGGKGGLSSGGGGSGFVRF